MEIQKIDVRETFRINLQDPFCRYAIIQGMQDELAGKELEHIPVSDPSNLNDLIWLAEGMGEWFRMSRIDDETNPVEKLMPFTKLKHPTQQRILYRAHVMYQKCFQFRELSFPTTVFKLKYL